MSNTDLYIKRLMESNPLREPLLRSIVRALKLPAGSHGLDAGCGIGCQSILLAMAVGRRGHVTGLDILPELLAYGTKIVAKDGLSGRITFREGDISRLPFQGDSFDWLWSCDCIGYPAGDLTAILPDLKRVVKPGGRIFLLGWSSQQFLPGYPLLEARLNGNCSGYLPFLKGKVTEQNFMRAVSRLREAGLVDVQAQTYIGDVQAPLNDEKRMALTSLFEMLWGAPQSEVADEDWAEVQCLCRADSANFILDLPDYYGFFTYSLFQGTVVKNGASYENKSQRLFRRKR